MEPFFQIPSYIDKRIQLTFISLQHNTLIIFITYIRHSGQLIASSGETKWMLMRKSRTGYGILPVRIIFRSPVRIEQVILMRKHIARIQMGSDTSRLSLISTLEYIQSLFRI